MTEKSRISAEALALISGHPLAEEPAFLIRLSEALGALHDTAPLGERLAVLHRLAADHVTRLDAEQLDAARAEAVAAERSRIGAILALDEAAGREAAACELAFRTDVTAEAAAIALAGLPKAGTLTAEQRAYTERLAAGPRAKDAPGGLVTADALGLATAPTAALAADPTDQPTARVNRKAMWADITGKLNGTAPAATPGT